MDALQILTENNIIGQGQAKLCDMFYEHIYSPIRQKQTEKYRYIQRPFTANILRFVTATIGKYNQSQCIC